jgi:PAS domain-containing protein
MSGNYAYTPYIWPPFLTVILLATLSAYGWRRRSVPGALPFMIGCLFAALWAVGSVMEYAAVDVETKIFWAKFQSVWPLPLAIAIFCFVLEYAWPGRWLTRRDLTLLSIPWLLILGLILTNDLHHLAWRSFEFDGSILPRLGPAGWIMLAYAYGVVITNIVVLAWLFLRSPFHRWPVFVLLLGQFGGRTVFLLERFDILHSILPIDVLGMGFEFLMYAIVLFGFRLFDPIPLANQMAIEQLQDGVLVLDPQGRVASLNPAAEEILGKPSRLALGESVRELLPAYLDGHLSGADKTVIRGVPE